MSRFGGAAAQRLADLAKSTAEPGRLSRGRALFRKAAVSDLSVIEGSVMASVRGSGGNRYGTTVGAAPAPLAVRRRRDEAGVDDFGRGLSVDELMAEGLDVCPREIDLAFSCDCPDWEEPCKHAVAVLMAFADRVDLDDDDLLLWRGVGSSNPRRRAEADGPEDRPGTEPGDRDIKLSALKALLGDTAVPVGSPEAEGTTAEPTFDPVVADFLGVGASLDPVDTSELDAEASLFAGAHFGPLATLAPELAKALDLMATRLDTDPGG